jgi:Na+/H+ antiporter NhaD/arsenite permease-like protein
VLYLARIHNISPKLLLLSLAFAVTIGSAMSPIGNPQNLLIAINGGLANPFLSFLYYLFLPTILNLFLAYLMLRIFFRGQFCGTPLNHQQEPLADSKLAFISKVSFVLLIILVLLKIGSVILGAGEQFRLIYIAMISALPILIFSPRRVEILKKIDWPTLIFCSHVRAHGERLVSGLSQSLLADADLDMESIPAILALSVLLSQLISNVPFVALYQPLLAGASVEDLMALAAGSTIAGNLFILGAASNVIIIQNAERSGETLTFLEFAKVGIPLTAINVLVYWLFL